MFDGYLVKYGATVVALLTYAAPMYFRRDSATTSRDDLTQDYIRAMRLLQNTSRHARAPILRATQQTSQFPDHVKAASYCARRPPVEVHGLRLARQQKLLIDEASRLEGSYLALTSLLPCHNIAGAVGNLVLVHKRVTTLARHAFMH